ncbi:MAG: NUDIX hydrolase [Robiginitomaculum sp.]|nr:NUDIX hydrolase [Robiginitomaculum sp.]
MMKPEQLRDTDPADNQRIGRATKPVLAATLVLLRKSNDKAEFLMGRRSAKHKFMPGKFVFPGGKVDRNDHRAPCSTNLRSEVLGKMNAHITDSRTLATAAAAIRETCEETGLKLAQPVTEQPINPPSAYQPFFQNHLACDLAALSLLARAITPPYHQKRYDTWFFTADTDTLLDDPVDQASGELEDLQWVGFDESEQLDLPLITKMVLRDLRYKLANSDAPIPYYFTRRGKHIRTTL